MDNVDNLIIYPFPAGEETSDDFSIAVNGKPVFVYRARVSAFPFNQVWPGYQRPLDQTELASFAYWDISDPAKVEIISKRQVKTVDVKPSSFGIKPEVNNNKITFTIASPKHITVEVNGTHRALHLFVNPVEEKSVDKNDPKVKYFGLGVHKVGKIELKSDEIIYIDGGAVVHGAIEAKRASDIKILGRGILDTSSIERHEVNGSISLYKCSNVKIDGIVVRDPNMWTVIPAGCQNVHISNIKLVGLWRYNSDGIDVVNSQHVRIERCFIRSFDDSIVIKGLKDWGGDKTDDQNVNDIVVDDCVVWCDWGRALEIGAETRAEEMSDVLFKNCNIIRTQEVAMDIQHGDRATVKNIRFENINVEIDDFNPQPLIQKSKDEKYDPKQNDFCPKLFCAYLKRNFWSRDDKLGSLQDVYVKDINVTGKPFPASVICGNDEMHMVENITIENVRINGKVIKNADEGHFKIGNHAHNIKFKF